MEPNAVVWIDIGGGALARAERADGSAVLTDANGNADCCCGCPPNQPPCCCVVPPTCPELCDPNPPADPCRCSVAFPPQNRTIGYPAWVSWELSMSRNRTANCANPGSQTSVSGSTTNSGVFNYGGSQGTPGFCSGSTGQPRPGLTLNMVGTRCDGFPVPEASFINDLVATVGPLSSWALSFDASNPGLQARCTNFGCQPRLNWTQAVTPIFDGNVVTGLDATFTYNEPPSPSFTVNQAVVTVKIRSGPWYPCGADSPSDGAKAPCSGCGDRVLTL